MQIILTNGIQIEVQPVPPFALAEIQRRHPDQPQLAREAAWLMALPTITVPEDWQFPRGLQYAGVEPRPGNEGRLLDYIEYGLLIMSNDIQSVQSIMYGGDLTEEEISAAEEMFPVDRGQTATSHHPRQS